MTKRHRAAFANADRESPPDLNLTPLIDVVFVVLICFILIAPLLELEQIQLSTRGQQTKPFSSREQASFEIRICADNTYQINQCPVNASELPHVLRFWKVRSQGRPPLLFCDRRAHFGTYQNLKNALESSGFAHIDLVLAPTENSQTPS